MPRCGQFIGNMRRLSFSIEKFFIAYEIPIGLLTLKRDLHKILFAAEVNNRPFEGRLDQAFDRP